MLYLDDLKYLKLYKKKFFLPITKDKMKGSAILLLTPNYESSLALMNNQFAVNRSNKSFHSYYIEKDITYTINHESRYLEIDHSSPSEVLNEAASVYRETTDIAVWQPLDEMDINPYYCRLGDKVIFFNEMYDPNVFIEASGSAYNTKYKKLLYNDRIRNNKEVYSLYKTVKADNPWIKKTFVDYAKYKKENLFVDLYYYNQIYLGNNHFTITKSIDMYFEFIKRFILDRRIDAAGYTKKTVFIPIDDWTDQDVLKLYDYKKLLNPISVFYKKMRFSLSELSAFNLDFVFFGKTGYFKVNLASLKERDYVIFNKLIERLRAHETVNDSDEPDNSPAGIAATIIDKLEDNRGIVLTPKSKDSSETTPKIRTHGFTGEELSEEEVEEIKAELAEKIEDAASKSDTEEQALDKLDDDEELKRIIAQLEEESESSVKLSAARLNRINQAQDNLMKKSFEGKSIKDMVNTSNRPKELSKTALPIKTINKEWSELQAVNFEKEYDLDADIIRCLNSLSDPNKEFPVSILDIKKVDTSTAEDSKFTYTVNCEDYSGKRFTIKFDIPKFRDNRFMRLRGNEKIFSAELPLIPISKTDDDTVQLATFYNKVFISRYYTSSGKSNMYADRVRKALLKYEGKDVQVITGTNLKISEKYDLPIDYIDLTDSFTKVIVNGTTIYFNQDEIRSKYKINNNYGIPVAVDKDGNVMYYDGKSDITMAEYIKDIISSNSAGFDECYEGTSIGKKYTYSKASILNTNIPIIVILAHDMGLTEALKLAEIKYEITDKKSKDSNKDSIKFADGYIVYEMDYSSIMMMNGLKDCDTESMNISQINSKAAWVEQLDYFGGRIKSDGLDNFKDLMMDPISAEVCRDYELPDTYHGALVYANNLLADNKYIKHTDLSSNRIRTNEVVAAQFYRVLSSSYKDYALMNKHGRHDPMRMSQDAVLNLILEQNTTSDLSIFQPLMEIETRNAVSTKGVTGMNAERAYGMDKRGYHPSMVNVIAQATGFANTVGVNRQMSINPNISGGRGYIKQSSTDNASVTNTLCMTEALSPFTVTSDDVFRNDMTFVQTSKHTTPIEYGTPLLVTTGADAAMPYLSSDMFAHKAKKSGTVKTVTDEYLLVEYNDGSTEYVNIAEQTMKNSDGGFYITLKLRTDLKAGDKVKENTILAYDQKSFSNRIGDGKQIAYNTGCLTKTAILMTSDGFEDSGVCSEWLSEAMASDIVVMKDVNLDPMVNVLFIAKKGQEIREGEPILIFQNAYDEADANILLKNLNNEDGDVSEIGRNVIKSKVTGIISDIKIYRTVDTEELSESLQKIVKKKESEIKALKKIADKASNDVQFDPCDKLPQVGKLKNVYGVRIEIFMRYHDKLSIGDKLSSNANKNVLMNVYSNDDAPYTDFRPNEKIDLMQSCSAIDGRMITSIFKQGALNKCMIELSRSVCDIMGVPWKTIHEIYDEDMKARK